MRIAAPLALVVATGCAETGHDGARQGSSGVGGSGYPATGGRSSGPGGEGNSASGGSSSPARCEQRGTTFWFLVNDPSGARVPSHSSVALRGILRDVDETSLSIEGCGSVGGVPYAGGGETAIGGSGGAGGESGSGAGCESSVWTVDFHVPDFVIPGEAGMQVNLAYGASCSAWAGCNRELVVRDELARGEPLLLAMRWDSFGGHAGPVENSLAWPVTTELVDLGCRYPGTNAATWALRVTTREAPAASLLLHTGESGELALGAAGDGLWLARNVSTFDVGGHDATTRVGFYLAKVR